MRKVVLAGAAALIISGVLKGLSLQAGTYPLIGYTFTYADGPVRRALFPSMLSLFNVQGIFALAEWMSTVHIAMIVVFAGVFLHEFRRIFASGHPVRQGLGWMALASSILPVVATLNGYFDVVLLCALYWVWRLVRQGNWFVPSLLVLVLGLQHEIAYLFGLCLFAAQIILEPQGRKTLLISSAAVVALAVIWIGLCSLHRPDLLGIAAERCVSMRPNGYPNAHEVWDVYCLRHTEATLASDFRAWRPILLPFQFIACGIFNLVMMVTVLAHLRQTSAKRWQVASLLGVLIIPYGLVTIALDVDRIVVMSAFVNWLIIDAWLDLYTVRQKGPGNNRESRMSRWGIALLVLLQVPLNYPSIDSYGQYRLLPPDIADRYLIATRSWVTPIFTRYNLQAPAVLNPDICLDFRCSRGQGGGE